MVAPHTVSFADFSGAYLGIPAVQSNQDLAQIPAVTYPHSGVYIAATATASPIYNMQAAAALFSGPPEVVPIGASPDDAQFAQPSYDVAPRTYALLRSSGLSIGSPRWWAYRRTTAPFQDASILYSTFFVNFTLPQCFDPANTIEVNYTVDVKSDTGSDPVSGGADVVRRLVSSQVQSYNRGFLSDAGDQFWATGSAYGLNATSGGHTAPFGTHTYTDSYFLSLNEYTSLVDNAAHIPGAGPDWSSASTYVPAGGDRLSLVFTLNTGTAYNTTVAPVASPNASWIEISNLSITVYGDCGGKNQAHIF